MDEPESLGAISLAGREKLDNLIFVINCNLQRLDGPVRGNGKIVQELEADFRGAGWNVIKCLWGSNWDPLLARDTQGKLRQLMEECVDGEYQDFKSKDGAYIRKNFFGRHPETAAMVADWTDDQIWALTRGGHDPIKVYAAYKAAADHKGQPTVILAKTVKGYGMGEAGEGQMIAHQQKKLGDHALKSFRDRLQVPISDEDISKVPFLTLPNDSEAMNYLRERRAALGGSLPARRRASAPLEIPPLSAFDALLHATAEGREISTTMAFVRILTTLLRDKTIGPRIVPIVPDESRTFGMEGLFRQIGIFSQEGQLYRPQDADQLMYYREDPKGQILQEGINEPGAMASFIAAGTSYSTSNTPMIPFYVYYSMFGFQRVGDLAWAAGDMRARGFLIGGTSGRTTLNGEGLQHEDGHSHVLASTIPNCVGYDPTYAYEVAVIIRSGLKRMYVDNEDVYFYITTLNENYPHPAMPEGAEEGILKRNVQVARGRGRGRQPHAQDAPARLGRHLAGSRGGGRSAGQGFRRLQRNLERDQLHRAPPRRSRDRALEHAASGRARSGFLRRSGRWARAWGRSSPPPTTSRRSPTASGPTCRRDSRRSAPMVSAAPTTAESCGPSSRSTAITLRSRR